ncbi:MAG: hypothetical protein UT32_C0001G0034 [Parcubacteria group bacterium GW2011_GWC2_39_14]|nr:MAG: hypothetical protein UT32_C0001G0034 [Parcubacteria group bacterium GW2011_GWC2_39_14]KKR55458.1 MAG: hypothetical protein UT91_C0001G0033 [Parcubacteria group bacterium GW2011_GWA2_40_23]
MSPKYNLDKIKHATDAPTFQKAIGLYEGGKVINFHEDFGRFSATVLGTEPYMVYVDGNHYGQGACDCYLGQNDTLCKHMVAVAIYAVLNGQELSSTDKNIITELVCSAKSGALNKEDLAVVKKNITSSIKYIKAYVGPSRTWFAYQNSLDEGCSRLSEIVCSLPISLQTAKLIVNLLLRLDKKLCQGGVDDSNGTVGGFIEELVKVLEDFVKADASCLASFNELKNRETCFGWEEPLLKLLI